MTIAASKLLEVRNPNRHKRAIQEHLDAYFEELEISDRSTYAAVMRIRWLGRDAVLVLQEYPYALDVPEVLVGTFRAVFVGRPDPDTVELSSFHDNLLVQPHRPCR